VCGDAYVRRNGIRCVKFDTSCRISYVSLTQYGTSPYIYKYEHTVVPNNDSVTL